MSSIFPRPQTVAGWLVVCLCLLIPATAQSYDTDKAAADKALNQQDYSTAIAAFRKLVSDYPDRVEAYNALGFALFLSGDFDEAIATFENALAIAPEDDAARRNLILAGGRKALESSYRDGLSRIEMLKARFPNHPQLAVLDFYLGKLHYLYGFSEAGLESWKSVAKSRPDSGTALFLRAVEARKLGDATKQNQLFQKALQQMPTEEVFRLWGARLLIEKDDSEKAAILLTPLLELPRLSPGVAIALSRFERMRGRTLPAFELLRKTNDVAEVVLERALLTQQLGGSRDSSVADLQKALELGGEGALLVFSDEPGARVYLDGTLIGSPPLGLYPSPGEHEIRVLYKPRPVLYSKFLNPSEGLLLIQTGAASGIDLRAAPSQGESLP